MQEKIRDHLRQKVNKQWNKNSIYCVQETSISLTGWNLYIMVDIISQTNKQKPKNACAL